MSKRSFFSILSLSAFAATSLSLAACDQKEEVAEEVVRPVRAMKVADSKGLRERWFSGRAKATREIDLSFRVSGPLIERPVDIGSVVGEGQMLAKIDPATFQAEVDQTSANLERARASLKNAEAQLKRQRYLTEKGHQSEAVLDKFIAARNEGRADMAAQQAALKKAKLDLGYTNLKAPFGGTVVQTYVENFQDVRPKQPVVRLVDTSKIEMVVNIPESLIYLAPQARNIIAVFDAFPDLNVPAKIKEIGSEASETTRTYPVTLIMDQPNGAKIFPGMAGKASAETDEDSGRRIVVPAASIFTRGEPAKSFVWVIDEEKSAVSPREISLGDLSERGIEVTSGLNAGEWIAISGANRLRDGQPVRILEQ